MIGNLDQALLRIKELEEKIENQQILIDALIDKVKKQTFTKSAYSLETDGEDLKSPPQMLGDNSVYKELDIDQKAPSDRLADPKTLFDEEVENMFKSKKASMNFKESFTFESFIAYAGDCHSFSLHNRCEVKTKNPVNAYIKQNEAKIIRHLMNNLNAYDLNAICSSLNLISREIDYHYKLVIAHDIILFIEDFSRVPFMISALFNNQDVRDDVFGRILKQILIHQFAVDRDIYRGFSSILSYYNQIMDNFEIQAKTRSPEDICKGLVGAFEVFEDGIFNPAIFPNMYAMRALCHYMDWDFAYNKVIHSVLYPRLVKDKDPLCVVYIFAITFNALRIFGRIESVDMVIRKLGELMVDSSDLSISVYLFIKQVDPERADTWLNAEKQKIERIDIEYLKRLIIY